MDGFRNFGDTMPVSLGTTIMAIQYDGGVILGADSRTSSGDYVGNRASDKITRLSDKVFVCRSGSAADTQNMASYIQNFIQQHEMEMNDDVDVKVAANLAMQMAYSNKNMLQAGLIVAGWDKKRGGQVFGIPIGGSLVQAPFSIGGSGSTYIYALCDKIWKPQMTEEEARAFVIRCVSHAMARDGSSGGCIRMVTIDKAGARREFVPGSSVPLQYGEGDTAFLASGIRA